LLSTSVFVINFSRLLKGIPGACSPLPPGVPPSLAPGVSTSRFRPPSLAPGVSPGGSDSWPQVTDPLGASSANIPAVPNPLAPARCATVAPAGCVIRRLSTLDVGHRPTRSTIGQYTHRSRRVCHPAAFASGRGSQTHQEHYRPIYPSLPPGVSPGGFRLWTWVTDPPGALSANLPTARPRPQT
jgi:hypothetical protein